MVSSDLRQSNSSSSLKVGNNILRVYRTYNARMKTSLNPLNWKCFKRYFFEIVCQRLKMHFMNYKEALCRDDDNTHMEQHQSIHTGKSTQYEQQSDTEKSQDRKQKFSRSANSSNIKHTERESLWRASSVRGIGHKQMCRLWCLWIVCALQFCTSSSCILAVDMLNIYENVRFVQRTKGIVGVSK